MHKKLAMPANKPNPTGWGWQGKNKIDTYAKASQSGFSDKYLQRYALQQEGLFADTQNPVLRAQQSELGKKMADSLQGELDAQLELEFKQWLNGVHPINCADATERRATVMDVIRDESNNFQPAMDPHKNPRTFVHTWWRTNDLKHLPGVRDYLTTDEQKIREQKLKMAKLAHFGPQNVEEAWKYFKTFVKQLDEETVAFDPTMSNYWRNYPALKGDPTDKDETMNLPGYEHLWGGRNPNKDGEQCNDKNTPAGAGPDDGVNAPRPPAKTTLDDQWEFKANQHTEQRKKRDTLSRQTMPTVEQARERAPRAASTGAFDLGHLFGSLPGTSSEGTGAALDKRMEELSISPGSQRPPTREAAKKPAGYYARQKDPRVSVDTQRAANINARMVKAQEARLAQEARSPSRVTRSPVSPAVQAKIQRDQVASGDREAQEVWEAIERLQVPT